jgi:hypothetical protein
MRKHFEYDLMRPNLASPRDRRKQQRGSNIRTGAVLGEIYDRKAAKRTELYCW